jgi:glutamine---fructose-6-phosphate transaminase (isomerizing)
MWRDPSLNHLMIKEALETPARIEEHRQRDQGLRQCVQDIRKHNPRQLITVARGSSDHAAQFFSYIMARYAGLIPSSLSPSLVTLHEAPLQWEGAWTVAFSQSGASPDLCRCLEEARRHGALTMAWINQEDTPLSRLAQYVLPMGAGPEHSVAATKSFILSLFNALNFVSIWLDDKAMQEAVNRVPAILRKACDSVRNLSLQKFQKASSLMVLGRGQGLPVAQEIALKFNEVCRLPALAYSSAEFRHGPMALIGEGDPVLVLGMRGPEWDGIVSTVKFLRDIGATVVFVAPDGSDAVDIPFPVDQHPLGDPMITVQILYPLIAKLAVSRGYDPDQPAHLRKVTMTL